MKKMNKLAVAVFAVLGLSGCASTQIAGLAGTDAAPAPTPEVVQVLRPTQSYGSLGGYRYRRFAVTAL